MLLYVVLCVLGATWGAGWVKVANFYSSSSIDAASSQLFLSARSSYLDLEVVLADTNHSTVRLLLRDVDYYGISPSWTPLNESLLFARLSVFVLNHAHVQLEHILMRFQGNMTLRAQDRSLLTVVNDGLGFSGYMCNVGSQADRGKVVVDVCLHAVLEQHVDPAMVQVLAKQHSCRDCELY